MNNFKCFLFFTILFASSAFAEKYQFYYENELILVEIPEGFCDASENEFGKFMIEFIDNQKKNGMDGPELQLVFDNCLDDLTNIYPWGYIGTVDIGQNNYTIEEMQNLFNLTMQEQLGEASYVKKLSSDLENAHKNTLKDYGVEAEVNLIQDTGVIWYDEDVVIIKGINTSVSDGEKLEEIVIGSSTLIKNNLAINFYITDLLDNGNLILNYSSKLEKASKKTKKLNKK